MIFKNFKRYKPEHALFGDDAVYLIDDAGNDWYDAQKAFPADTLKVVFDKTGKIISCSKDVSALFPLDCSVLDVLSDDDLDLVGHFVIDDQVIFSKKPSDSHEWNGKEWEIPPAKMTVLLAEERAKIRTQINTKRDECVDGGVYVPAIDKWVDTDEKGRATLVEIKADFDLNGRDNTYTLICADNTAKTINFDEFKAVWDAVKTLKEKMFENAYMHKILLENSDNPADYDWSIGWSKTYQQHLAEVCNE